MKLTFPFQEQIESELQKYNIDTNNKDYILGLSIDSIETPENLPFDKIYKGTIYVSDEKTFYRFFNFTLDAKENIPSQTTCKLVADEYWLNDVRVD